MQERKLRVLDANLLYLIGAILFLVVGSYVQYREILSGLLITQYVLILLPPLLYLLVRGVKIKKTLRFNPLRIKHGLLVAIATACFYPAAVAANAFMMYLLSHLGNLNIPQIPTAGNAQEYALLLFIISLSAGFCEEVFFRGFILRGYEPLGTKKAIIISGILFGIFHFNLYNLLATTILGILFAYVVTITDSIFAGMVGHVANNAVAVSLGYVLNLVNEIAPMAMDESLEMAPVSTTTSMLISFVGLGVIALGTMWIGMKCIKIIKRDMDEANDAEIKAMAMEGEDLFPKVSLENSSSEMGTGGPFGEDFSKTTLEDSMGQFHGSPGEAAMEKPVTRFYEYIPLGLVLLMFCFLSMVQILEIINLG